jgi:hypothetical protein
MKGLSVEICVILLVPSHNFIHTYPGLENMHSILDGFDEFQVFHHLLTIQVSNSTYSSILYHLLTISVSVLSKQRGPGPALGSDFFEGHMTGRII